MRKIAFWFQVAGVSLIAAGIAAFSVPFAVIVVGVVLLVAGEVHG